ncbi:hypothetical protein [Jiella sp. M17.18]|uniref:hypothetical protein n=1 Tax=Jiella sp. M17.18 TaxID=3234247 RepID=UPI0034DF7609
MKLKKPENSNPVADLSDMQSSVGHREDDKVDFKVELTFGSSEIPLDGRIFEVAVRKAVLRLQYEGVDIDPGSRYGQRKLENEISTSVTTTDKSTGQISASAAAKAKASGSATTMPAADLSAEAGASASYSRERSQSRVTDHVTKTHRVTALGGDRWQLQEPADKAVLDGTYIHSDPLCTFTAISGANRHGISAIVSVRQRDLNIVPNPDRMALIGRTKTRDKLIAILLAKAIHRHLEAEETYQGLVDVSVSRCETDD